MRFQSALRLATCLGAVSASSGVDFAEITLPALPAHHIHSKPISELQEFLPRGHNVHFVGVFEGNLLWRGGAPSKDTIADFAKYSDETNRTVTYMDLRKPEKSYDRSGENGGLNIEVEEDLVLKTGMRYVRISALDSDFTSSLSSALKNGDVYIHCMYGVNRTGYAIGRLSEASGVQLSCEGLDVKSFLNGAAQEKLTQK